MSDGVSKDRHSGAGRDYLRPLIVLTPLAGKRWAGVLLAGVAAAVLVALLLPLAFPSDRMTLARAGTCEGIASSVRNIESGNPVSMQDAGVGEDQSMLREPGSSPATARLGLQISSRGAHRPAAVGAVGVGS